MRGTHTLTVVRAALFVARDAALVALLLFASPSAAEEQALEAVGVVPVREGEVATRDTRSAAVSEALREAVLRVAREILIEAEVPEEFDDAVLARALGAQALPYTNRYKIVEDQGERPALFGDDPDASSEYVVIVEVSIETDRVAQRLIEAGLLAPAAEVGETTRLRVEIRGLLHYPGYTAMRDLIAEQSEALRVDPIEFARGRAIVEIEVPGMATIADTEALLERLVEVGPPELTIEPVRVGENEIVVAATWTPPQPVLASDDEAEFSRGDRGAN